MQITLIGCVVRALKPDMDCDGSDRERPIPVGSLGVVRRVNYIDSQGLRHYDVAWDNGALTVYSQPEVMEHLQVIGTLAGSAVAGNGLHPSPPLPRASPSRRAG